MGSEASDMPAADKAEEHYDKAMTAIESGGITEAIINLQAACRLAPDNPRYSDALDEIRQQAQQVSDEVRAPVERSPSMLPGGRYTQLAIFGAALVGCVAAWGYVLKPAPEPENLAAQYADAADFSSVYLTETGALYGSVNEAWLAMDPGEQYERCQAIVARMKGASGTLTLISNDGLMILCDQP